MPAAWEEIFLKIQKLPDVIYVDKNAYTNCYCLLLFQIEASEFWYNSTSVEGFF